jgi:hypothetical protein
VTPTDFVGSVLKTAGGRFCGLGPQNSGRFSRQHMVTISALSLCILISISLMNHEKLFPAFELFFSAQFYSSFYMEHCSIRSGKIQHSPRLETIFLDKTSLMDNTKTIFSGHL